MPPDGMSRSSLAARKKPRYFYGWNIVAASFLAHLSYAEHHSSVLGFFIRPFQNEFGWSRTQIAGVVTVARLVEAAVAPLVGPLIDRHGPRVLMPVGAIVVGLTMLALTQINALWQFWLLRGVVVALGFTLMGALVTNVAVSKWFVRKRGRAIAIGGIGSNLGNMVMTPVTVWVLAISGWQTMFVIFAVLTWLAVLLPSAILMRRQPEDMGLHPDGIDPAEAAAPPLTEEKPGSAIVAASSVREPIWTRREVFMTVAFWQLAIGIAVANLAFQGINISLAPYMQDLHYADALVAAVVTFRSLVMAVALTPWGFAGERVHLPWIRIAPFLLQGLGAFFFLLAEEPVFLWLAVSVYGLGFAGVMVVQEVLWANFFGRLSLGLVRSLAWPIAFGFSAVGPIFMTGIFDILGSFQPAFLFLIGVYLVASVLIWMVRPPRPLRYATAEEMTSLFASPPAPPAH